MPSSIIEAEGVSLPPRIRLGLAWSVTDSRQADPVICRVGGWCLSMMVGDEKDAGACHSPMSSIPLGEPSGTYPVGPVAPPQARPREASGSHVQMLEDETLLMVMHGPEVLANVRQALREGIARPRCKRSQRVYSIARLQGYDMDQVGNSMSCENAVWEAEVATVPDLTDPAPSFLGQRRRLRQSVSAPASLLHAIPLRRKLVCLELGCLARSDEETVEAVSCGTAFPSYRPLARAFRNIPNLLPQYLIIHLQPYASSSPPVAPLVALASLLFCFSLVRIAV
nr:hypothetical protein CFP56_20284 [Quercus suber]